MQANGSNLIEVLSEKFSLVCFFFKQVYCGFIHFIGLQAGSIDYV